jgi:hypothetical protein
MAVKTLQVTQTASAVQVTATVGTYARWIVFQNTAAAVMRLGDANVTTTRGYSLPASNAVNSVLVLEPMPNGQHYDLSQWWTIGTNTQLLDVIYDSMN